jgi:hypothetical protein
LTAEEHGVINAFSRSIQRAGDDIKKTKATTRAYYRSLKIEDKKTWLSNAKAQYQPEEV